MYIFDIILLKLKVNVKYMYILGGIFNMLIYKENFYLFSSFFGIF